ncbi:ATP:cob(I)alamin adenosyltransferase [Candidatus Woesebacteria bacterium RIFCSPLOWO2_01_FULL_37_19]|uniref:Corrinoid adenosyltransferase n=2 Tax=Candidatus Woeseibacteriota TaxID=1752722 RepID=A0A1F8BCD1_9BACT|nr:MAG: ATP:cob(I)alamin adenosyltransferase [Candidatus Woesebacteria bacterium RIFCSPHIGHO2_01_FULL_38_26b]OGM61339.1 MAG: ATP:cob(I)alamin adenosyltransferase [Candidatus Woesebacteria bacterium RIFCSPLOWO2_01_FULL_37_19]
MAIYTKKGDKGETSMYDASGAQRARVSKSSLKVEALGAIDELNSFLGVVKTFAEDKELIADIARIQVNLLTIGSITAGSKLGFSALETKNLEKQIDNLEGTLPVLKNFVIPGGSKTAGLLQFARSLSRRAERRVVSLSQYEKVRPQILEYLNRLSDFLFMLAREQNHKNGIADEVWVGKKKR